MELHHQKVLKVFEVNAKDRKYHVHNNPVTVGICSFPEKYKYSAAIFYETGKYEFGMLTYGVAESCCWCSSTTNLFSTPTTSKEIIRFCTN